MKINNLDYFVEEIGGDELFEDEMCMADETVTIPAPKHFLGASDRREKLRKRQVALKKASMDENEKIKQK